MKLKYVSITGADDGVNIGDLNDIAQECPFVEWALLLMPEREGLSRFPTARWRQEFLERYEGRHKALHLCGNAFARFVDDDRGTLASMEGFGRIQLNLEFADMGRKIDPEKLIAQIKKYPAFEFIIQYTDKSANLLPALRVIPHHSILFDQSAGRGVAPESWPLPLPGHSCGYAGGITPDNVTAHLEKIAAACGDQTVWIDMESGMRTDDCFDLDKVRRVLDACTDYL